MTFTSGLVAPLAVAVTLLLAACAAPGTPEPTASPGAADSPTPTPSTVPVLTTLTILGDGIVATDSDETEVAHLDYFAPKDQTVSALTELLGFEPTVSVVERTPSDRFAGTLYDWEGFTISWQGFEDEPGSGESTPPLEPSVHVSATVADVRGVEIEGPTDVKVGDPAAPLVASYPTQSGTYPGEGGATSSYTILALIPLPPMDGNEDGNTYFFGVTATAAVADGPITQLSAPSAVGFGM
ncbi:hypothetical protein BH09ACT5_BH09ACT5_20530 [soil metagenome]